MPDRAIEHPSGSIVVTASTAGLRNDPFVPYSYAIAKAGVPFSYAAYSVSPMNAFHSPEYTPPSSTSSSCVPISATFP